MNMVTLTAGASGRRRTLLLILIGVAAFLAALVIRLPAAQAWHWFGDDVQAQAYGLRGTVWNGEAAAVISGQHRINALRWELQPGALLGAQLGYNVRARVDDGRVEGVVRTGLGGGLRLQNLRFDMDAGELVRRVAGQTLPVTLGGRVDGFLEEVVIDGDGRLQQINGLVNWTGGSIGFGDTVPLGSYALRLDSRDGQIIGQVLNTDAVLRLEGDLSLDPATGEMTGEVLMQALEDATRPLLEGMRFIGVPDPADENRVRFQGNINNPLGFRGNLR